VHSQSTRNDLRVLTLAPTGKDAVLLGRLLEQRGRRHEQCFSLDALIARARLGVGVVIIAAEALVGQAEAQLTDFLDHQPSWSDLPVVLLASERGRPRSTTGLWSRFAVTILDRPVAVETFLSVIRETLRFRSRQYELRDIVNELRDANQRIETRSRQLQRLALALTEAENRERRRIASILHDNIQQLISAAVITVAPLTEAGDQSTAERATRAASILNEALAANRSLSHELVPTVLDHGGLGAAVERLADDMRTRFGLHVRVEYEEVANEIDSSLHDFLFQTLRELLFNVVKHAETTVASVSFTCETNSVRVVVRDEGKGMDPSLLSAESVRTSNGLGLFSIRERLEYLGGDIQVESSPGRFTQFTLVVPRTEVCSFGPEQAGSEPQERRQNGEAGMRRPLRVVVADDHHIVRQGLVSLLSRQTDVEVVGEAANGSDAVRIAVETNPDILIVDYSMPEMDGAEATRRVLSHCPGVRVVALSAFESSSLESKMLAAGACVHLTKSKAASELLSVIRNLCA